MRLGLESDISATTFDCLVLLKFLLKFAEFRTQLITSLVHLTKAAASLLNLLGRQEPLNLSLRILPQLSLICQEVVFSFDELLVKFMACLDDIDDLAKDFTERVTGERIFESSEEVQH